MNIQDFMFWLSIYVYFEAQGSNTFSFARSNPKRFPVSGGWIITMSGIPLTDEGVTSDGGAAGETISLPPKTSKLPTPRKCKMSTWKEMQRRLWPVCMHSRPNLCISVAIQAGLGFINHTLKIGFSHIILFSGYAVSDVAAMSPREQRHVRASSIYSCTHRPWKLEWIYNQVKKMKRLQALQMENYEREKGQMNQDANCIGSIAQYYFSLLSIQKSK